MLLNASRYINTVFCCRHNFATLAQTAIVIFWPFQFSPLVVTWRKVDTIVCSETCDKHVSYLCVVFVSKEYPRELIKMNNLFVSQEI